MTINKAFVLFLFVAIISIPAHIRADGPCKPDVHAQISTVGGALDKLSQRAEEWGTMHFSAPLLVEPSTNFNFNLQRGTSNYFSEAKSEVQAQAASFSQVSQSLAVALQAQNMPGLSNSVTSITSSNLPSASNVISQNQSSNATSAFNSTTFAAALGLLTNLGSPSPTLDNTSALNIAAGDQTTEAIFRLLGDPEKAALYEGKKILYGVVTVSIDPGYRTRQNYVADLGVLLSLQYTPARPEVIRRWLLSTNLPDEVRACILTSYNLQSNDDLVKQIPWSAKTDTFKALNSAITNLAGIQMQLTASNALVKTLQDQAANAPANLKKQKAQLQAAQAQVKKATDAFAAAPDAPTKAKAQVDLDTAQQNLVAAQAQLKSAQAQVDKGDTDVKKAAADVLTLSTQLDAAQKNYQLSVTALGGVHITDVNGSLLDVLTNTSGSSVHATAVSPLADLNVIDEGSSQRNQSAFAASLAGLLQKAGLQAQAAAFEQYAKRVEDDTHTRTALPSITTYGDGGLFGWEVGPRLRAMEDPGIKKSRVPADILDRQTFPALIIVGFNAEDLFPHISIDAKNGVKVLEPNLDFRTIPRWMRAKNGWWGRLWQKRFKETALLETSAGLVDAKNDLSSLAANNTYSGSAGLADVRLRALKFDVFGGYIGELFDVSQVVPLPTPSSPSVPSISSVFPANISLEADAQGNPAATNVPFAMVGNNLKGATAITSLCGGISNIVLSPSANNNIVSFSGMVFTNGPILFQLSAQLTNADGSTFTTNVLATNIVNVAFHNDPNAPQALIKTVQNVSNGTNTTEFTVKIASKYDAEALKSALSIILNDINKNKPFTNCANVSVQVQAEQKKQ